MLLSGPVPWPDCFLFYSGKTDGRFPHSEFSTRANLACQFRVSSQPPRRRVDGAASAAAHKLLAGNRFSKRWIQSTGVEPASAPGGSPPPPGSIFCSLRCWPSAPAERGPDRHRSRSRASPPVGSRSSIPSTRRSSRPRSSPRPSSGATRPTGVEQWMVLLRFDDTDELLRFPTAEPRWRPSEADWAEIKQRSVARDAEVAVVGVGPDAKAVSSASVRIRTSEDPVGDSIFYREVPLPFITAVQDPSRIRWRFGSIDSETAPPIVLENLPVCGNCHSFSGNGSVLGLDVDYGNDKGGYAILPVSKQMVMNDEKIITWSDYKRDDGEAHLRAPLAGLARRPLRDQHGQGPRGVRGDARDRVLPALLPDQGHPRRLRHEDRHLHAAARRRRPASTSRATRPGAPTASRSSSPGAKVYRKDSIANATSVLLEREGRPRVHRGQEAVQVRPVPGSVQRRPRGQGRADRGRLAQREEQLLREVLAGRQVDRLLQGRELHAADAGQRALHHPGRRRRGAAPAREHARS